MTAANEASCVEVRGAKLPDVDAIQRIVAHWAQQEQMLPRRREEIARTIRDFAVAVEGTDIVGCGALHLYGADLAEVRSLAVRPDIRGGGVGAALVAFLATEARALGLPRLFAFTYLPAFFERQGFRVVPPETLPQKAWRDCIHCPKRTCCDEIAVVRELDGSQA